METFSPLLPVCCRGLRAGLWTDSVYLHVSSQRRGLVHRGDAEQRTGGRPEDHNHSAAGDRAAAEGDHCEPKGDNQGANVQAEPLRESEPPGGGGTRGEETGGQEHHGGCISGYRRHSGAAGTDFTDAQTETGESGGRLTREALTAQKVHSNDPLELNSALFSQKEVS